MRNPFLKELKKIEFAVTYACTGSCIHCSEGNHLGREERIDAELAADAVRRIAAEYEIETVMVFGGEPLLHTGAVYSILNAAKELGIPRRQIITNGCFTASEDKMREVALRLRDCGVNDLLLSVDAFHQRTLPIDSVKRFAAEVKKCGIPIRLQPAWLVGRDDDNPYNRKTRAVLESFDGFDIPIGAGNTVFPDGNAKIYLAEYFTDNIPENPYTEDPCQIKCLSFSPDGGILDGNFYSRDIMEIIRDYKP